MLGNVAHLDIDPSSVASALDQMRTRLRQVTDTRNRAEPRSYVGISSEPPLLQHLDTSPHDEFSGWIRQRVALPVKDRSATESILERFSQGGHGWQNCGIGATQDSSDLLMVDSTTAARCAVTVSAHPPVGPNTEWESLRVSVWRRTTAAKAEVEGNPDWARTDLCNAIEGTAIARAVDLRGDFPAIARGGGGGLRIAEVLRGENRVGFPTNFTLRGFANRAEAAAMFRDYLEVHRSRLDAVHLTLAGVGEPGEYEAIRQSLAGRFSPVWVQGVGWTKPGFRVDDPSWRGWVPILRWDRSYRVAGCSGSAPWGCAVRQDDHGTRLEISTSIRDPQRVLREAKKLVDGDWRIVEFTRPHAP
ncbi:MAG: hypothetical protein ACF8QF_11950 [Phycisphaerales bacterium]